MSRLSCNIGSGSSLTLLHHHIWRCYQVNTAAERSFSVTDSMNLPIETMTMIQEDIQEPAIVFNARRRTIRSAEIQC